MPFWVAVRAGVAGAAVATGIRQLPGFIMFDAEPTLIGAFETAHGTKDEIAGSDEDG